jgi:hypothetical protein
VIATNFQASLRDEFGHAKFYLLVDEARDESKREQIVVVVTTFSCCCKINDELRANQVAEVLNLIELNELETGSGAKQIGALQRLAESKWSSHFSYVYGSYQIVQTCTFSSKSHCFK